MAILKIDGGHEVLVDDDLYPLLSVCRWHVNQSGRYSYVRRRAPGGIFLGHKATWVFMHRAIMACPVGMVVDHINKNTLDNRRENLRITTHYMNVTVYSSRKASLEYCIKNGIPVSEWLANR